MRARIVLILATPAVLLATACGGSGDSGGSEIVGAFYPLTFAAMQVDRDADVVNLTPAGAEPHDLELTARDVERLGDARLVLHLEGFMPALDDAVDDGANTTDLLDGLDLLTRDGRGLDPHVWLDPLRYATIAKRISAELGAPADATRFVAALEELDADFRDGLANCERRTIVTSHAAFRYLADAYGLEQIALTGVSPEVEPSAQAIERLVAQVEDGGATTVFFETLVSPSLAETVAREAGATTAVLNPLEGLTDEELEAGADYFTVMRENLATLRTALGCR